MHALIQQSHGKVTLSIRDTTIIEEKGGVAPVKMHSSQNAVCQDVWSTPVLTGFLALTEVGCQPGF